MQDQLLIEKVRRYEFLYNQHSSHYRDQNMRQEAWEEIARELNSSASQVKDMWSKLRNCYSNALKRRKFKKSGQAAKKYTPWKYEDEMSFLQPYFDTRPTQENLEEHQSQAVELLHTANDNEEDNATEEGNEDNDSDVDDDNLERSSTSTVSTQSHITHNAPKVDHPRAKRTKNAADEMVSIMKKNAEQRMKKADAKENSKLDESDMFYLSMSKNAKKLPEMDQAWIRLEICKLVSEAQMRHLQGQTWVPPSGSSQQNSRGEENYTMTSL
ncbi:hypothetical protein PPYR_06145 [Photinus pyralis]|uniref:MADF domain-containing protein n=1 Tax=Photinus pyralis TaxID=7054 RepID=A0A5N4ASR2_PHOPY|nr:uncharacterized protein LOC116167148 [Photinus pyralis]KAB0800405.1 hypothetical protein PPYR_06145 [Photinus pyralis]